MDRGHPGYRRTIDLDDDLPLETESALAKDIG